MKGLPQEIKILRLLKGRLDLLMSFRETPPEIRSNDLYEFAIREPTLRACFAGQKEFNQFLRKWHDEGVMKQFIPNYSVDTSNRAYYQWRFSREIKPKKVPGRSTETIGSTLDYYKNHLTVRASDGTILRSAQEKDIYEQLRTCDFFTITYEAPIYSNDRRQKKFADFKIINRLTQKTYYWEHFGMTDSENYRDEMVEKLAWYTANGFRKVEDGGNLIFTTPHNLQKDILKYLERIKK